ncbi:hypothetical protein HNQ91_002880 [Filimonas zeae]|uniref:Uncharacterized protein n=1 Tax=Filimonas zeae TaxID=1737353 RepID=A0A917IZR2_9BACT|nr:hypothetical protein [Filimonas zeae]MDR6339815.1 hypothetical protein [Filimonas zeae]GGH69787.1 hypothetical protein GCM10011379_27430 [Filimonas zeae]
MSDKKETSEAVKPAPTGNASNPSPADEKIVRDKATANKEKAEKYIRESGNIEDMPDAEEEDNSQG